MEVDSEFYLDYLSMLFLLGVLSLVESGSEFLVRVNLQKFGITEGGEVW